MLRPNITGHPEAAEKAESLSISVVVSESILVFIPLARPVHPV
jgi:hypothetical protein